MIGLDSPEWAKLSHAYGDASDIPQLLRQLESFLISGGNAEPWFSIWSALAHQGDVYSASFASVPHVIRVLASDPLRASAGYFRFPAWVEICRQRHGIRVPDELAGAYFQSLKELAGLVGAASSQNWDLNFLGAAMSAPGTPVGLGWDDSDLWSFVLGAWLLCHQGLELELIR